MRRISDWTGIGLLAFFWALGWASAAAELRSPGPRLRAGSVSPRIPAEGRGSRPDGTTGLHKTAAGLSRGDSPDTLRILGLMVQFRADSDPETTGDGRFALQSSGEVTIDPTPHDAAYFGNQLLALSNYYSRVSGGRLVLSAEVHPRTIDLPDSMARYYYGEGDADVTRGTALLFRDAIRRADEDGVRFSSHDCFIVFHAGVGRDINFDYDATPKDIPSVFLGLKDLKEALPAGEFNGAGLSVENGAFGVAEGILLPETESQDGYEIGLLGTAALMFGFQLGLPAMWNVDNGASGIGRWGLMDQGSGNFDGMIPAEPSAFDKVLMGWETPVELTRGTELRVACSSAASAHRIFKVPINDHEYFLIENRQYDPDGDGMARGRDANGLEVVFRPDGRIESSGVPGVIVSVDGYDFGLPGSGILIWHVDDEVVRAGLSANRVNTDPGRRGVDLEEADGAQDIGQSYGFLSGGAGSETGVMQDAWYAGNDIAVLVNSSDSVAFTPGTHPNSRSNSGANTHVTVFRFSPSDTVMTFSVTNDRMHPGFPRTAGVPSPDPPLWGDYGTDETMGIRLFSDSSHAVSGDVNADGLDEIVRIKDETELSIEGNGNYSGSLNGEAGSAILLFSSGLTAAGKSIAVGTKSGSIMVFSGTGEPLWDADISSRPICGLACWGMGGPDSIFAIASDGKAVLFGPLGEKVFEASIPAGDSLITRPVTAEFVHNGPTEGLVVNGNAFTFFNSSGPAARLERPDLPDRVSSPAVGDVDGDGDQDIALTGGGKVWCFGWNGSLIDHFPVQIAEPGVSLSDPVLGDVDGDGKIEVVSSTSDGRVVAIGPDGSVIDGFPLPYGGGAAVAPVLAELDGDGKIELATATDTGILDVWDMDGPSVPESIAWGHPRHDPQGTGRCSLRPRAVRVSGDWMPSALAYNYPNPAPADGNDYTMIRYRLESPATVSILIVDLAGELIDRFAGPGEGPADNEIAWNLRGVDSGVYFCRVKAEGPGVSKTVTIKIAVVK
jgi:M6 family metalloprotease-like protein